MSATINHYNPITSIGRDTSRPYDAATKPPIQSSIVGTGRCPVRKQSDNGGRDTSRPYDVTTTSFQS